MGIANISQEQRDLIDEQLIIIAKITASQGRDTKVNELIENRRQISLCFKAIKKIDVGFWEEICPNRKEF